MHAHPRAEIITNFCVSRNFDSFAELEGYRYMEKYWHIMERGDFCMIGHEMGQLTNITYPRGSHYGAGSRGVGLIPYGRSIAMIMEYLKSHQILLVIPNIHPLNNAPSNWSIVF